MTRKPCPTRQEAISALIREVAIADQKQLVALLFKRYGIETNQAGVSRDLRNLGVVKKKVGKAFVYEIPDLDVKAEILRLALLDISHNETMIVIKTYPALADFVGDCVDQQTDLDVLGCLAGENVVFVIPKSIKNIGKTCDAVCKKFNFKKEVSGV